MRDKQDRSATYGKAKVSGDVPQHTPKHGPYGHTDDNLMNPVATNTVRPEENDKNPKMPCKNSLPT